MTVETLNTNQTRESGKSHLPTHVAKVRNGYGKKASYERIGVAWVNEDGSYYVKLHGTQVISQFALYPIETTEAGA